jgi:hypothetical protein
MSSDKEARDRMLAAWHAAGLSSHTAADGTLYLGVHFDPRVTAFFEGATRELELALNLIAQLAPPLEQPCGRCRRRDARARGLSCPLCNPLAPAPGPDA